MVSRILAATAAVLAALLATAGLAGCTGKATGAHAAPSGPTSVVPPRAADDSISGALGADVIVGDQLHPLGGPTVSLPGSGDVYSAHRVADGWLVERGDKGVRKLWLVPPQSGSASASGAAAKLLVDFVDNGYAVGPDGKHIAYQQGNWLSVATIAGGKVSVDARTQLPGKDGQQGRTGPTFAGWAGSYLVIGDRLGIDYAGFDVWDPAKGGYNPTFNKDVYGVFGTPDTGRTLLGAVAVGADRHPCLAVLDPTAGLKPSNVNCGIQVHPAHGWLAPDARHLAGWARDTFTVYEVSTGAQIASVPYQGTGEPVWLDATVVLVPQQDRIVRLDLGDPKHPQDLPLPDGRWVVVPHAGS